jgi:hypothetical protein
MKAEQTTPATEPVPTEQAAGTPASPTIESPFAEWIPSYRVIGLVLLVVLLVTVWVYASRTSREAASKVWTEFARPGQTITDLEAQSQGGSKHARLELARNLYGPQGLALLQPLDKDQRNKGIANIQKARDEFVALADLFKGDVTLRASCLVSAAEAELTLVGIPKDGSSGDSLGTVTKAADLYKAAADTVGDKSALAEQYRKRIEELNNDKGRIEELGREIINRLAPPPTFNLGPNPSGPTAPTGPITIPKPPETKKEEGPKAPAAPVTPPTSSPVTPPTAPNTPATAPSVTPPTGSPAPPTKK